MLGLGMSRREALRRLALFDISTSTAAAALAVAPAPVAAQTTGPSPRRLGLPPGRPVSQARPSRSRDLGASSKGRLSSPPDPTAGILVIHGTVASPTTSRSVADRLAGAG